MGMLLLGKAGSVLRSSHTLLGMIRNSSQVKAAMVVLLSHGCAVIRGRRLLHLCHWPTPGRIGAGHSACSSRVHSKCCSAPRRAPALSSTGGSWPSLDAGRMKHFYKVKRGPCCWMLCEAMRFTAFIYLERRQATSPTRHFCSFARCRIRCDFTTAYECSEMACLRSACATAYATTLPSSRHCKIRPRLWSSPQNVLPTSSIINLAAKLCSCHASYGVEDGYYVCVLVCIMRLEDHHTTSKRLSPLSLCLLSFRCVLRTAHRGATKSDPDEPAPLLDHHDNTRGFHYDCF